MGLQDAPLHRLRAAVEAGQYPRTTSTLVLKDGQLVFEEYFGEGGREVLNDTRSVTKSVTALAVGAALAGGTLRSVAERAFDQLVDLAPFAHDGPKKRAITLEDFLTMSSALDCNDDDPDSPGNEENMYPRSHWARWVVDLPVKADYGRDAGGRGPFAYCTAGTFLLGQILQRAVGEPTDAYTTRRIFAPLGIVRMEWARSPGGEVMTGGGLRLRSRDLAKLGQMILAEGRWNDREVLPAEWIRSMLSVHRVANPQQDYGYLMWRRDYRTACSTTSGWYMSGNGGNAVVIMPGHDLVAVVTRRHYNSRGMHQQTVALLENHVFAALGCAPASEGDSATGTLASAEPPHP